MRGPSSRRANSAASRRPRSSASSCSMRRATCWGSSLSSGGCGVWDGQAVEAKRRQAERKVPRVLGVMLGFPMVVGEIHEEVPVDGGQIVFPFAEVEADMTFDLGPSRWERRWERRWMGKAMKAEQLVSGIGVVAAEEFTERVGPQVEAGTGDIGWTWGDGGDEEVLIEG